MHVRITRRGEQGQAITATVARAFRPWGARAECRWHSGPGLGGESEWTISLVIPASTAFPGHGGGALGRESFKGAKKIAKNLLTNFMSRNIFVAY
jgi:hypothetical protein